MWFGVLDLELDNLDKMVVGQCIVLVYYISFVSLLSFVLYNVYVIVVVLFGFYYLIEQQI